MDLLMMNNTPRTCYVCGAALPLVYSTSTITCKGSGRQVTVFTCMQICSKAKLSATSSVRRDGSVRFTVIAKK